MNLSTGYMGLTLRNPLIASASPLSRTVDDVRRLADAGVGAIVLYSLFEEQVHREQLRDLMGKGLAGTVFLTTDDCWREYREMKERGVEFVGEPEEQMYGIDVGFRDPSGNNVRLSQLNADFGR